MLGKDNVLDVDVEDGTVLGVLSHRPLSLQHDVLRRILFHLATHEINVEHLRETSSKM